MTDRLTFVLTLGYFIRGPELSWKQNTVSCSFTGQITAWAEHCQLQQRLSPQDTLSCLAAAYETSNGASGKTS